MVGLKERHEPADGQRSGRKGESTAGALTIDARRREGAAPCDARLPGLVSLSLSRLPVCRRKKKTKKEGGRGRRRKKTKTKRKKGRGKREEEDGGEGERGRRGGGRERERRGKKRLRALPVARVVCSSPDDFDTGRRWSEDCNSRWWAAASVCRLQRAVRSLLCPRERLKIEALQSALFLDASFFVFFLDRGDAIFRGPIFRGTIFGTEKRVYFGSEVKNSLGGLSVFLLFFSEAIFAVCFVWALYLIHGRVYLRQRVAIGRAVASAMHRVMFSFAVILGNRAERFVSKFVRAILGR